MSNGTFYTTASPGGQDSMMPSGQGQGACLDTLGFVFICIFYIHELKVIVRLFSMNISVMEGT